MGLSCVTYGLNGICAFRLDELGSSARQDPEKTSVVEAREFPHPKSLDAGASAAVDPASIAAALGRNTCRLLVFSRPGRTRSGHATALLATCAAFLLRALRSVGTTEPRALGIGFQTARLWLRITVVPFEGSRLVEDSRSSKINRRCTAPRERRPPVSSPSQAVPAGPDVVGRFQKYTRGFPAM